jgi:hypothetical protein
LSWYEPTIVDSFHCYSQQFVLVSQFWWYLKSPVLDLQCILRGKSIYISGRSTSAELLEPSIFFKSRFSYEKIMREDWNWIVSLLLDRLRRKQHLCFVLTNVSLLIDCSILTVWLPACPESSGR